MHGHDVRILTRTATWARPTRTRADATVASTPSSSRREPRPRVSGFSPRTCRTLRLHLEDLHARRSLSCATILVTPPARRPRRTRASSTRRWMPCTGPHEVTSTVTEHETVATRHHVSANAPGRIEGSRQHSNLAVTSERNMHRHDVRVLTRTATWARPTRTRADATVASTPSSSRREPRPRVSGFSPRTWRTLRAHLEDLHARRSLSCATILVTPPSSSDKSLEHARMDAMPRAA
jgi:hypothetical protein